VVEATVNPTVPLPVPFAPAVIVSHVSVVEAVQPHPDGIVTATFVAAPPAAGTVWLAGLIDAGHAPACVTVCVWPAIVMVPTRLVELGLATNVNATVPLPLPLAPLVIVIHDAAVLAVHAQPVAVVTAIDVPVPAVAGTDWLVGLIDEAQEPACVTE